MKKALLILFFITFSINGFSQFFIEKTGNKLQKGITKYCLLYTSDAADE